MSQLHFDSCSVDVIGTDPQQLLIPGKFAQIFAAHPLPSQVQTRDACMAGWADIDLLGAK